MTVDQKIIEGCKAGKRRAQNRLYTMYAGAMLGVCLRYCSNLAEAEDVLQEGFIKVFTNISRLKDPGAISGWIRKIMVNTAITHATKKKLYFDEIKEDTLMVEEPEEATYQAADPELLIGIIQNLPAGYRMVLNLFVFEDYSHKEISEALNISESTSKSQLFKARKAVRKEVESMNMKNKNLVNHETRV